MYIYTRRDFHLHVLSHTVVMLALPPKKIPSHVQFFQSRLLPLNVHKKRPTYVPKCTRAQTKKDLHTCTKSLVYFAPVIFAIYTYGVAPISRLLKIIGLFCKRALQNRRYSAKETYDFKEPTNRSHPIYL